MIFVWTDEYSVGNPVIDGQHRQLFQIANEIGDAGPREMNLFVLRLYKYVREHFDAEESHMAEMGYPHVENHKTLHKKLTADLDALVKNSFNTDSSCRDFARFLRNWLINHIMRSDKDYFRYARSK